MGLQSWRQPGDRPRPGLHPSPAIVVEFQLPTDDHPLTTCLESDSAVSTRTDATDVVSVECGREETISLRSDLCTMGAHLAVGARARLGGRPAMHQRRRIVDAIRMWTAMAARASTAIWLPPWATAFWYFKTWRERGAVHRPHDALPYRVRDAQGRIPWFRPAACMPGRPRVATPSARRCAGSTWERRSSAAAAHRGRHGWPWCW